MSAVDPGWYWDSANPSDAMALKLGCPPERLGQVWLVARNYPTPVDDGEVRMMVANAMRALGIEPVEAT